MFLLEKYDFSFYIFIYYWLPIPCFSNLNHLSWYKQVPDNAYVALSVPTCRNVSASHSRPKMSYRLPLIVFVVLYITLQLPMRLFKLCTIFDVPRFPLLHAFPFSIFVVAFGFWVLNALPFRLALLCIYRSTHRRCSFFLIFVFAIQLRLPCIHAFPFSIRCGFWFLGFECSPVLISCPLHLSLDSP